MINDYSCIANRPGLTIFESVDSTNNYVKNILSQGNVQVDHFAVISDCQTGGRGRLGRSFYSPSDSGIYLTYAFRSSLDESSMLSVTPVVAALVHQVLSPYSDTNLNIKWVNDLYNSSGKITGILTELLPSGRDLWIVVGIGINVREVALTDESLRGIVGHLTDDNSVPRGEIACKLLDAFETAFRSDARTLPDLRAYYKDFCLSIGRELIVKPVNGQEYRAMSLDIDENYGLIVKASDSGEVRTLTSGEVSVSV